jgi:hypothetical protein
VELHDQLKDSRLKVATAEKKVQQEWGESKSRRERAREGGGEKREREVVRDK